MEGEISPLEIGIRPDELERFVLGDASLASIEQEGKQCLRLSGPGLLAAPPLDPFVATFHPQGAEGEHAQAGRGRGTLEKRDVEGRGGRIQLGPILRQVGQSFYLLILASAGLQGCRQVPRRQSDQLLISMAEVRPRARRPEPELAHRLAVLDKRDPGHPGTVRLGPVGRGDRAVRAHDPRSLEVEGVAKASQRWLDAGIGGLGRQRREAQGAEQTLTGDGSRRSVPKEGANPDRCRFVHGDRDHEREGRQQWQVQPEEGPARGIDGHERTDQQEQSETKRERRPEALAPDITREEHARRQDGRRREHHGHGHKRDADPWIGVAKHGEEPDGSADRGHHDSRQRDPELAPARVGRHGPAVCPEQPDRPDQQRAESEEDPRPAKDDTRHRTKAQVGRHECDRGGRIDDPGQGEQCAHDVHRRDHPAPADVRVAFTCHGEGQVRRRGHDQRRRGLLDRMSNLDGALRAGQPLEDDRGAPRHERQRQEREGPCLERARSREDGQTQPHAKDRDQAVRRDLELLGRWQTGVLREGWRMVR